MKILVRRLLLPVSLSLFFTSAVAQVTITASDVGARLAVGNVISNVDDTLLTSADIGSPGATSWDFTGLQSSVETPYTSVPLSSTPFQIDFPDATHALKTALSGLLPGISGAVSGDLYLYFVVDASLANPGNFGSGVLHAGFPLGDIPGQLKIVNSPADISYTVPFTLNSTWSSVYTSTQTVLLNGSILSTKITNHDIHYLVDAYGLMTLPGGASYDALRIRKEERAGDKTIGYIFVAKNGASVELTAADTLQPNSGSIQVRRKTVKWARPPESPVPIQLYYFSVSWDADHARVMVSWGTMSEVNNFGFEVQKAEAPNGDFRPISRDVIPGHGTTTVPQSYACVDNPASPGVWYYRLKQVDLDGVIHYTEATKVEVPFSVEGNAKPTVFALSQNFPNPFNPTTVVSYQLPVASHVQLAVYDLLGREVAVLVNEYQAAGSYNVKFSASGGDGAGLPSGVYYYRLTAGQYAESRRMLLLK